MSAPQHPNQPQGPVNNPEPTMAIGGPGSPDATQIVRPNDQPERTQVVRPGGMPPQPERTQVVRPGPTPPPPPQPQRTERMQPVAPPPGYPPQGPGFGQQLAQPPGYPPQPPGGYPPPPPQQPGYGYPSQAPYQYGGPYEYADWGKRFVAGLIDYAAIGVILVILIVATQSFALVALVQLVQLGNLFYNISYLGGVQGQTLGKKVAGIKLIREDSGQPVGFGLALGRALLHIVDALPLYIGFLAPLWEEKRQTWADKFVGTVVVVVPQVNTGYQAPQHYGQMPRQW